MDIIFKTPLEQLDRTKTYLHQHLEKMMKKELHQERYTKNSALLKMN